MAIYNIVPAKGGLDSGVATIAWCTVFIRIVAAATINFALSFVRLLIEGGSYSRAATITARQYRARTRNNCVYVHVRMCTSAHAHHMTLRYEYN